MAKVIQVTPEQLENTATKIEGLASEYKAQYEALYNKTNSMASTWSGKDNVAYIEQINEFKDDFAKMQSLMLDYATFLRQSAKSYRTTQDNVVTQAQKLVN